MTYYYYEVLQKRIILSYFRIFLPLRSGNKKLEAQLADASFQNKQAGPKAESTQTTNLKGPNPPYSKGFTMGP